MRRMGWTAAIFMCFTLILSACGTKNAESVVKDLDKVVSNMESYQGSGTMTLHTGQQPLEYQVEVSYQKPSFYRIKLTNEAKDITQIVLRNDEGVFVLTPKLNKVFRFQSDWPQNQGQVYLYQTLIQSILVDGSRQFAAEDNAYVFDVMANYNNGTLARQKIWLNKSDLSPMQVEVSDTNAAVMVDVKFDSFKFGPKFEDSVFETEANMKASQSNAEEPDDQETMATPEQNNGGVASQDDEGAVSGDDDAVGNDQNSDDGTGSNPDDDAAASPDDDGVEQGDDASASLEDIDSSPFIAYGPSYLPEGVSQKDMTDIVFGGNKGVMTRFDGIYSYTLIQTQPKDKASSLVPGLMVNVGSSVGEITAGDELQTLTWIYQGNEFKLSSGNLPESEMIKVAQSVLGEIDK
ncbi:outer membrane lipoprotein-sorting protein [Paenibacillus sp. HB172176]|uniref:outer membrane lipoprotein-sorting protein n=1 Tax=Paenibacillus sp. HB172176 TaxID=2493690 RepID=UPI0014388163|nr:outer membrane lipoprotein-sorting protein [Paenibacillus sp. HB172176]